MIWVAWRQHRAGVFTALGVITAAAAVMLLMRISIGSMLSDMGSGDCLSQPSQCSPEAFSQLMGRYGGYVNLGPLVLYLLPVVLGVVAGAPVFARELSQGSHMFSLTQSVSRRRWWAVKLGVSLVPIAVAVGLLGLYSRWALGPVLEMLDSRLSPGHFEVQGTVMIGYLVFAFAAAATLGQLTRNNVVPMVITVGVYIVIAMSMVFLARPSYLPPMEVSTSDAVAVDKLQGPTPDDAWVVGEVFIGKDGTRYDGFSEFCNMDTCDGGEIASIANRYHPASRFWTFQGIETGAYLVFAAVFLAVGARRLRALP